MRNQIITTFLVITILSGILVLKQKRELAGEESRQATNQEVNLKKINVFKWTMDQDYRRSYIKRINEKL